MIIYLSEPEDLSYRNRVIGFIGELEKDVILNPGRTIYKNDIIKISRNKITIQNAKINYSIDPICTDNDYVSCLMFMDACGKKLTEEECLFIANFDARLIPYLTTTYPSVEGFLKLKQL